MLDTSMCRAAGAARRRATGACAAVSAVERLARDPILLADADGPQPSVADVTPHGADVQPQPLAPPDRSTEAAVVPNCPFMSYIYQYSLY
jgi:hypothetical protein